MKEYFTKSIKKFKDDAFSKFIYDFLKWSIGITIVFSISKIIPISNFLKELLFEKLEINIYQIILLISLTLIITTIVLFSVFKRKYKILQNDYYTDRLTGLKNQPALEKYFENKIVDLRKNDSICSLILIDIDNFKQINEDFGYKLADEVIKKMGNLLYKDNRLTDEVFRYFQKGDEFLIILNDTSLDGAIKAAKRKKDFISKTIFEINKLNKNYTVSCGVTEFDNLKDDFNIITDRLNKALLEAKKQPGKNSVRSII